MNTAILNRSAAEAPAPGARQWARIETQGEHPAVLRGADGTPEPVVQVLDGEAFAAMVEDFRNRREAAGAGWGGMLVDLDHLSHDPAHDTQAQAWLHDLRVEGGHLMGLLEWTDLGAAAVGNKRVKWFSTEYPAAGLERLGGDRVRPRSLAGLALTNRPNNRGGPPLANRDATRRHSPQAAGPGPTKQETEQMNTIAEKLGLPPDATEEQILAAIDALLAETEGLRQRQAETEAEGILNRHAARIPEGRREDWKKALLANRDEAAGLLEGLPERKPAAAAAAPARIHNAGLAGVPQGTPGAGEATLEGRRRELVEGIRNRNPRASFAEAWETARLQRPELFRGASAAN